MGYHIYNLFPCGTGTGEIIWGITSDTFYPDFTILEEISTGIRYHVRKAGFHYYKNFDGVHYLANPDEGFVGGSDVVEWESQLMFNGHNFPPIHHNIDKLDLTVLEGSYFSLYPATYNQSIPNQTTNIGAKYLNLIFESAGVEMRAFPYIHDENLGSDVVAIVFNETDNFLLKVEKTTNGVQNYDYEVFGNGDLGIGSFTWNGNELVTGNYFGYVNEPLRMDEGFKTPENMQNVIVSNCSKEALYSSCVNNYGGENLVNPRTGEVFTGTGTMTYLVKTMDEPKGIFGFFDEGNTSYDWVFTSFKVNGVEHIITPVVQEIDLTYFNWYECFIDGCNLLPNFDELNGRIMTDIDEKVYRNLITLFGYENRIMVEKWGRSQRGINYNKFSVDELINTVEFSYKRICTGLSNFEISYNLVIDNTINDIVLEADSIAFGDNYAKRLEYGQGCRCSILRPCKDCECTEPKPCCPEGDVTLSFATFVKLPPVGVPDRGFKECCFSLTVLADLNSSDVERNDFNSFYFKKQSPSDSCDFVLMKNGTDYALDNTAVYGQFWDFGDFVEQPNLKVARVDWRKVLSLLGEGDYSVRQDISIAGLSISQTSNTFTLKHYTTARADKTIRIDSIFDGRLIAQGVDFFGTGFETTLRVGGFFGNAQRKIEEDVVIRRNYKKEQIKMTQTSEYTLETNLLPECITSEIFDFMLMANRVLISDYNSNNHSYKYTRFGVKIIDDKGTDYPIFKRSAKINLTFTDELVNKVKLNY